MDLLEKNAFNLIQLGFEDYELSKNDARRIISSIRNIYSGVMLLFKVELIRRSPKSCRDSLIKKYYSFELVGETLVAKAKGSKTIGLDDFVERFKLVKISVTDEVKDLRELADLRNSIEHHYTRVPMEMLANAVLNSFLLIIKFNNKHCKRDPITLYGEKNYNSLVEIKKIHDDIKRDCISKWEKLDFTNILNRVFPVEQDDDPDTIINFFNSIKCPNCRSDLVEAVNYDFTEKTNLSIKCMKCNNHFEFSEIIEEILERRYAYNIMKVGSRGGCIPLSICPSSTLGTFLEYESVCIYCGNKKQGDYDPNYVMDLFIRNVQDYSDDI